MMLHVFEREWKRERKGEIERERLKGEEQHLVYKCFRNCSHDKRSWTYVDSWCLKTCLLRMQFIYFFLDSKVLPDFLGGIKNCPFQLPPAPSPCHPSLVLKERRERGEKGFSALLLILLLSSQLPLLCIIQRSRLKAFTSLSDNEERRSLELY